jgi:hypothetical protein
VLATARGGRALHEDTFDPKKAIVRWISRPAARRTPSPATSRRCRATSAPTWTSSPASAPRPSSNAAAHRPATAHCHGYPTTKTPRLEGSRRRQNSLCVLRASSAVSSDREPCARRRGSSACNRTQPRLP